ncbi:MAG: MerR family transcriptional regulator [Chromatiaceae bacterium]|nr:MerR family transcriptional regulator [Chromatiaceae bacterium]
MSEGWEGEGVEPGPHRRGLYPIRTVSRLTGVPAVTLRAWERRHGILHPTRTDKGHRLYTEGDVDRVRQVVALLERGVAVGQAGALLGPEEPLLAVTAAPGIAPPLVPEPGPGSGRTGDPWPGYLEGMLAGARQFDTVALDTIYNDALSLYPIDRVSRYLTRPVLERLGAEWPDREASIAREHFFANFLRNKLGARFHHLNTLSQGPRLVAACLAGEHHDLGLLQFALAAAGQGYRLVMLGADVPEAEIAAAVHIAAGQAVLISASARAEPETLARQVATLVGLTPVPVLVGGAAADLWPQPIQAAGARVLGTDFGLALRRLGECLGSA